MKNEIWKTIEGYEGLYAVSNFGRVKNVTTGLVRRASYCKDKYLKIGLHNNGVRKTVSIHKLVAKAFIPNPDNKPQINHKDLNKENNSASNLEWVTGEENRLHAHNNGIRIKDRIVTQMDMDGNIIRVFNSMAAAVRESGIDMSTLCRIDRGIRKTGLGYRWMVG